MDCGHELCREISRAIDHDTEHDILGAPTPNPRGQGDTPWNAFIVSSQSCRWQIGVTLIQRLRAQVVLLLAFQDQSCHAVCNTNTSNVQVNSSWLAPHITSSGAVYDHALVK